MTSACEVGDGLDLQFAADSGGFPSKDPMASGDAAVKAAEGSLMHHTNRLLWVEPSGFAPRGTIENLFLLRQGQFIAGPVYDGSPPEIGKPWSEKVYIGTWSAKGDKFVLSDFGELRPAVKGDPGVATLVLTNGRLGLGKGTEYDILVGGRMQADPGGPGIKAVNEALLSWYDDAKQKGKRSGERTVEMPRDRAYFQSSLAYHYAYSGLLLANQGEAQQARVSISRGTAYDSTGQVAYDVAVLLYRANHLELATQYASEAQLAQTNALINGGRDEQLVGKISLLKDLIAEAKR